MTHPFSRDTKAPKKKHPLYYRWCGMKNVTTNPNYEHYHIYGGKGIKVCEEWSNNFIKFLAWAVQNGYRPELVLTRKDKNKDFEPSNCFWGKNSHDKEPINN